MATLLIDNYDSYTFNLYQLIAQVENAEPVVVRNDELAWDDLAAHGWDRIVISPGPGRPETAPDLGLSRDALTQAEIPVLGVCLGHEGLAHVHGATIVHAPEIVHGRISEVRHDESELFEGIPQGFRAVRYHSLMVAADLPPDVVATAWADDVVMAIRHASRPAWGVQFHPESVSTEHGARLMANFHSMTSAGTDRPRPMLGTTGLPTRVEAQGADTAAGIRLLHRPVNGLPDPEVVFARLFADEPCAFWLDSSLVLPGLSRYSFMGAASGPVGRSIRYQVGEGLQVDVDGSTEQRSEALFDYLSRELQRLALDSPELPFDFNGGFVGYIGYEVKADSGAARAHESELPDAWLLLADRMIAFDEEQGRTYVLALAPAGEEDTAEVQRWIDETVDALGALPESLPEPEMNGQASSLPDIELSRGRDEYLQDIEAVKRKLEDGESYEVCLTNRVKADVEVDPFELYRTLRRTNPAPYSAFLRFPDGAVLSSSPERFLSVSRDGLVETKPIKGTAARAHDDAQDAAVREKLRSSEKDRAENLMIVDLLRNDLGRVCDVGSVHVPKLMDIETYETVHQMVSTVRGRLRPDVDAVTCLRATFPGGSMTGAPKLRTMEIIDALEREARGVYAGTIGFLALNGSADLNIVIRTLVATQHGVTIGAGGAIVMLSDPEEEYEEMLLKARPLLRALAASRARTGRSASARAKD